MEILSNVWCSLSTENIDLVNILLIPLSVIEATLIFILFKNLLNIQCSNRQKWMYIIFSSVCSNIITPFVPSPFGFVCNYLIQFALIYFIFKQGFVKTLIALFLPALIFALVNLSIVKLFTSLLNITYTQTESVPIYRLIYMIIVYITVAFINFVLKHKNLTIKILEDFDKKTKIVVICNFILGLIAVAIQGFMIAYYLSFVSTIIMFLNFMISLAYFSISLYSLNKITKLTLTTRELETAEAYNKSITALYDNVKGFKHDFDNIVSAIRWICGN